MLEENSSKCKFCAEATKKAIMSAKFAHELKNVFIMVSTIVADTNKKRNSHESLFHQESGILSPFRFDRRKQNQNDISMDEESINVEDNEAKFSFLKSLCDYGKSLIKEMNKIFLEEKNPKCELFYVSDVIEFCVKMFKFKKYREGKKFRIRSDIKFSYNKAINSINETALKMVLINLLTNAYKFTEQGEIIVSAVELPEKKKIYICVKDTGVGFDVNEFEKKGIFSKYDKNEKLNTDGSGLGMEIVQDVLKKFNSELNFYSDPNYGGSIFYFELEDAYPYNDFIDLKKIMPNSIKKIFDDINSGKTDLFKEENNKNNNEFSKNDFQSFGDKSNVVKAKRYSKSNKKERNSFVDKTQIKELFSSALKQSKIHKKNIINLKKIGEDDDKDKDKPIFLETILKPKKKENRKENFSKKNVKIFNSNVPVLDFKNIEENANIDINKNMVQLEHCKSKLDANYDNTDFYILSLRHILEKEKIYNNLNKNMERKKTYSSFLTNTNKKNGKRQSIRYQSLFNNLECKRINIIICDDEYDVARAAEEIVKKYFKSKGFTPHVYYTKNGIECLYLVYKLSILEKQIIKFILMDVEMDVLDGIATCNIIKDNRAINQKVYLLSGDPRDCKADGYCSKPLTEADLKKIINL